MDDEVLDHVKDRNVWMRVLFMLLFAAIYYVSVIVLTALIIAQFLFVVVTGRKNERLLGLGAQLSAFFYQMITYLTYNSEDRPFPFRDWPEAKMLRPANPRAESASAAQSASQPPKQEPKSEAASGAAAKPKRAAPRRKAAPAKEATPKEEAESEQ